MGYRTLLKTYMAHVESLAGSDLVEVASITNGMSRRDLGELRAVAAELQRERHHQEEDNPYTEIVRSMVASGAIQLEALGKVKGLPMGKEDEAIPEEKFRRIIQTLTKTPD